MVKKPGVNFNNSDEYDYSQRKRFSKSPADEPERPARTSDSTSVYDSFTSPKGHFRRLKELMGEKYYFELFMVGILLILIGSIILYLAGYMDSFRIEGDRYAYNLLRNGISTIGQIIKIIGMVSLSIGVFIGGVFDDKLPTYARMGMLIALGLIIAFNF